MNAEEATINSDGSTTFEQPPVTDDGGAGAGAGADEPPAMDEEKVEAIAQGTDPAVFLLLGVAIFALLYYFLVYRKKKTDSDFFFSELDGEKVRKSYFVLSTPLFMNWFLLGLRAYQCSAKRLYNDFYLF